MFKKIGIYFGIFIISIITLVEVVRTIGRLINNRTPDGGINETMMVDINGTKQWVNIYGKNLNNPVLLFLHGGPGSAESPIEYTITRKWSDIYTVVSWDQRNCGKSYSESQNSTPLTPELFIQDGKEMTEFLLKHLNKDKISLLGHSWGTSLGTKLVHDYPKYYETYIGAGQVIDAVANEVALKEEGTKWAKDDPEGQKLVDKLTPGNFTVDHLETRNELMKRYHYDIASSGTDYSIFFTVFFNPYYSLIDIYNYITKVKVWMDVYNKYFTDDFFKPFSLLNNTNYEVPYYNIAGDKDYQTNHVQAEEYFKLVKAPRKRFYLMKDMTHALLFGRSDEFSDIVHDIYKNEYQSLENNASTNTTTTINN